MFELPSLALPVPACAREINTQQTHTWCDTAQTYHTPKRSGEETNQTHPFRPSSESERPVTP